MQGEFSAAIEKFKLAVSKSDGTEEGAKDALTNGYIQWAHKFSTDEDFLGALEQLKTAKQTAFTDEMKQSVEKAFEETYLAFSNSTGTQARRAMKEALIAICEKNKRPALPIFGLNKDLIRVGIYGVDAPLPEKLAAQTPGEMHYIACVEEQRHTVETKYVRQIILKTSKGYYYVVVQQFRAELLWDIYLLQTDTLELVAERTLTGGMPPPFPKTDIGEGGFLYGAPPTVEELSKWLQSVIK